MEMVNLVTPQEAAASIGVSVDTLRRWADEGKITVVKTPGGHRRYDLDELRRLDVRKDPALFEALPVPLDETGQIIPGIVPLGLLAGDEGRPVGVRNTDLDQHLFVAGRAGSGKTELLKWMVLGAAKADYALVVVDAQGDLSLDLLHVIAKHAPERAADVVFCDFANEEWPLCFNPLDVRAQAEVAPAVEAVREMLERTWFLDQRSAPRALTYIEMALTALCEANLQLDGDLKFNLIDVVPFFLDAEVRQLVVSFCSHVSVREMFDPDTGQFENLTVKARADQVQPIIRSFQDLTRSPAFASMFRSGRNRLDFRRFLNGKKIVILRLAQLHTQHQAGESLGTLLLPYMLSSIGDWGLRRDPETRAAKGHGCRVFVDEAPRQLGLHSAAVQILAEARKYDVGLVFAAQSLDQFDQSVIKATLANTASKLSLVLDPSSAKQMSDALGSQSVSGQEIAALRNFEFYANILIPIEGGKVNSGSFKARCPKPLDLLLSDSETRIRDEMIDRSRAIVSRAPDREENIRGRLQALKTQLALLHTARLESEAALHGLEHRADSFRSGSILWAEGERGSVALLDRPRATLLEEPEPLAVLEDLASDDSEETFRFRFTLADQEAERKLRDLIGLAGLKEAGFLSAGCLQFADFECRGRSFGEVVGRMIEAVEGAEGKPRVISVERLDPVRRRGV
jgi:excisionase family DNA binding protein